MDLVIASDDPLRRIGFNPQVARALGPHAPSAGTLARVIEQHGSHCMVHDGKRAAAARPLPALTRQSVLAVGDWILTDAAHADELWIASRVEPYTTLQRIDPSGERRILVSNVDVAFLVMGLDGDFSPRRLERYLALCRASGVFTVVVLTKADLCTDVDLRREELAARLPSSLVLHAINATDGQDARSLLPYLKPGHTGVLLGSSGAGKSTLTNALVGCAVQETGAVRAGDSRGRHTTTSRQLHQLANGACLIDTPGLRGLRLDLDETALESLCEDIAALAPGCRYRDCAHQDEPGCAVREQLTPDRLANYHKMRREVARDQADALALRTSKAKVKSQHRALRAMQRDRRR